MVHRGVFPILLVSIVLCSGCADPPVEEMMQAETAIQIAQAAGANEYASADFRAAAAALADAKSRTERKDYEGARASALDALQKSEAAKNNSLVNCLQIKFQVGEPWLRNASTILHVLRMPLRRRRLPTRRLV